VERLGSVETVSVTGSHLVGMSVLLSAPARTIPVLSVHGVATGEGVQLRLLEMSVLTETRLSLHGSVVQGLGVFKPNGGRVVSRTEGRLGENAGFRVGVAGSGDVVVLGVVVRAGKMLGLGSVSATSGLTGVISLGNEGVVESSRRKIVLGCINAGFVEHTSRLLSDGVTQMSVSNNVRSVTSVSGNSHGLTGNGSLGRHVVGRGSVEVIVSPVEEFFLSELGTSTLVADSEFSSRL